ncbi:hypothetical protein [Mycobacterium yunnanensis]|nr:hypothetical protein [Mycobacterium yunnanensis]
MVDVRRPHAAVPYTPVGASGGGGIVEEPPGSGLYTVPDDDGED